MEKICQHAHDFMEGLISKDEFLVRVAEVVLTLNDNQAMALAILMHGEEDNDED